MTNNDFTMRIIEIFVLDRERLQTSLKECQREARKELIIKRLESEDAATPPEAIYGVETWIIDKAHEVVRLINAGVTYELQQEPARAALREAYKKGNSDKHHYKTTT